MTIPEVFLEDKSRKDTYNLIRQVNKNLLFNIEIIYILSNNLTKAEYSNKSLILSEGVDKETVYSVIAESLLQIEEIILGIEEEYKNKKKLSANRELLQGIVLDKTDLDSLQTYLKNCLLYYLDRKKELAVVYPLTYSVIKRLYNKGIKHET